MNRQRLVLDTNVWLDWLVFDDAALAPLKELVGDGHADIVIDDACEEELARVLAYPLQKWTLDVEGRSACLVRCRQIARKLQAGTATGLPRCADPDDQKFLELAAGAAAQWLLTRDHALLRLDRRGTSLPFHIVTPAAFAARLRVESPGRP